MRYKVPVLEHVTEMEKFGFILGFKHDLSLLTFVSGLVGKLEASGAVGCVGHKVMLMQQRNSVWVIMVILGKCCRV